MRSRSRSPRPGRQAGRGSAWHPRSVWQRRAARGASMACMSFGRWVRSTAMRALVTGATGFVGGRLARAPARAGRSRCARWSAKPGARPTLERSGCELHEGDVLDARHPRRRRDGRRRRLLPRPRHGPWRGRRLRRRGSETAARNFARMAAAARASSASIYLGGLGDNPGSQHLRSRHETALILAGEGPPLTYLRAGMVVGAGSESYRTLRYLVRAPAGDDRPGLAEDADPADRRRRRRRLPRRGARAGGGRRAARYRSAGRTCSPTASMLDRMAAALGRRPGPKIPVPLLTPWLSSLWIGLVTPVDAAWPGRWSRASRPRPS